MLPQTSGILEQDFEVEQMPSKTFAIQQEATLNGFVDGREAVSQAVYCILNTERYDWLIYNWNYGVELKGLFGRPINVVKSKVKKRIKEALMQDDRIQSVDTFSFESQNRHLHVSFTVRTQFGDIEASKEVNI